MEKAIEVKNIIKSFGSGELEITVLKDITLDINKGDFIGLLENISEVRKTKIS